jgi:hypothetical protein
MVLNCFGRCGLVTNPFYAFGSYFGGHLELMFPLAAAYAGGNLILSAPFNFDGGDFGFAIIRLALMGWCDAFSWGGALGMFFFFWIQDCFALGVVSHAPVLALTAELQAAFSRVLYFFFMGFVLYALYILYALFCRLKLF